MLLLESDHNTTAHFFQSYPNSSNDRNLPHVKLLETVALTKQAMCLAVSPYTPGEGVVVRETGAVHSWRCGQELVTVSSAVECQMCFRMVPMCVRWESSVHSISRPKSCALGGLSCTGNVEKVFLFHSIFPS